MAVSRCEEQCYRRAGCIVLNKPHIRDFTPFLTSDKTISDKDEYVFFPVPNSVQMKALQKMMDVIPKEMLTEPTGKKWNLSQVFKSPTTAFKLTDLAKSPEIPLGSLDDCYLVRYMDPGHFHIILDQCNYYYLKGTTWNKHFPEETGLNFQSGLGLYRALIFLLSRCMSDKMSEMDDNIIYQKGDLVICAVPRQLPSSSCSTGVFGYRGVIVKENVETISVGLDKDKKLKGEKTPAFIVYLLDTGEERIIEKGAGYLTPLPEVFILFPPLAIPCALHGVSPAGSLWDKNSKRKMMKLICTEENVSGEIKLIAEFFSKYRTSPRHGNIWASPPYFVEITACFDGIPSSHTKEQANASESGVLVSSVLIKNGMAVEWNFTPRNAGFCREIFNPMDPTRPDAEGKLFDDDEIPEDELKEQMERERRGLLLHLLANGNPGVNRQVSIEQRTLEIKNAIVTDCERLDRQIIQFENDDDDFEDNILSMRFDIRK